jgi:phospholipid/cholesterol/gamma-HCH transport system substrate-binding protein
MTAVVRLRRAVPVAVAALVLAVLLPGCKIPGQQPGGGFTLTAYFPSAVSLYPKSSVRILGLNAGTVTKVATEGDRVMVRMSMAKSAVLPKDVKATIVPQSLLGERYIQLYPPWVDGQPRLDPKDKAQTVIGVDRTSVPVEPDEALAALKRLLDDLDPNATGRLITNLNQDLHGNGQILNDAVKGLGTLTTTLADKDQQLVGLIDNFDHFTTTLETRETQLGKVMDLFAQTTSLLAQERGTIATLLHNLSNTAVNALDLVSKHGGALQTDVSSLTGLLASLDANLGAVSALLSSAPVLTSGPNLDGKGGLIGAYNAKYRRIDLRSNINLVVQQLLTALGVPLCITPPCLPGQIPLGATTQTAPAPTAAGPAAAVPGQATPLPVTPGPTPTTTRPPAINPFGSTTTTTQPGLLPPLLPGFPDVAMNPLSPVMSLLGSPGAAGPLPPASDGVVSEHQPTHQGGPVGWLARWSHSVLKGLW